MPLSFYFKPAVPGQDSDAWCFEVFDSNDRPLLRSVPVQNLQVAHELAGEIVQSARAGNLAYDYGFDLHMDAYGAQIKRSMDDDTDEVLAVTPMYQDMANVHEAMEILGREASAGDADFYMPPPPES